MMENLISFPPGNSMYLRKRESKNYFTLSAPRFVKTSRRVHLMRYRARTEGNRSQLHSRRRQSNRHQSSSKHCQKSHLRHRGRQVPVSLQLFRDKLGFLEKKPDCENLEGHVKPD
ncbi:hypothetical protein CDAR_196251 [Caerostris darwini]|uniref:Uncharacterized protein n=1 Tax=Caerostris darwini TaxID=1538125 RepID=A0AAV4Q1X1_9ARAC|nr:hypothetical protein CDAR_196251 [Caerostris darwini]